MSEEIIEEEIREALPPERERELAEALARKKLKGATTEEGGAARAWVSRAPGFQRERRERDLLEDTERNVSGRR